MKKILLILSMFYVGVSYATMTEFTCGPGYVLVDHKKIDGVDAAECQKLWCVDLETGKAMGRGETANSGYQVTAYPDELKAADGTTITCWGDRKWCAGQVRGQWEPKLGLYVRDGGDNAYESYQKGSCFTWRVEEHNCPAGTTAFLNADGVWECLTEKKTVDQVRGSAIRRTSAPRRILQ